MFYQSLTAPTLQCKSAPNQVSLHAGRIIIAIRRAVVG